LKKKFSLLLTGFCSGSVLLGVYEDSKNFFSKNLACPRRLWGLPKRLKCPGLSKCALLFFFQLNLPEDMKNEGIIF